MLDAFDIDLYGKDDVKCCEVCGNDIRVMAYRGTGVCSQLHEKVAKDQLTIPQVDAILAGTTRESTV